MLMEYWGQIILASIRGGMPMINDLITVLAFSGYFLEKLLNCDIPLRLLGVNKNVSYLLKQI